MAKKDVYVIFQDCPECDKEWWTKQTEYANKHGFVIHKISFAMHGMEKVIRKAATADNIRKMPFFTDDLDRPLLFSYELENLFPPEKPTKKKVVKEEKKGNANGGNSEN